MSNSELFVSVETLLRIFVFLLYAPVVLISYWKLIPRLSPISKRIATGFLAAQVLVVIVWLEARPTSVFEWWLWHLSREWNISSTLASMQLALVGFVALTTAWLAKARPAWQRLYLVGIGLLFLFLAWDEYFVLHERILNWKRTYAALGAAVAAATGLVAVRSPRRAQIWHICLLTGLAMAAVGAMVFEILPKHCDRLGFLLIDGCLRFYIQEESLEFLGIWLTLVAMLGQFSDAAPMPKPRVRHFLYALPALWILLLFINSLTPRLELRLLAQPATVQFESGAHLHGYGTSGKGEDFIVWLYSSSPQLDYIGLGYSIHLVDQVSEESVTMRNEWADRRHSFWVFGPDYAPIYRQRIDLEIPPQTPTNRAFWLVLNLWRRKDDKFIRQRILASDHQLLDDTQVVLDELVIPAASTAMPPDVSLARFDNGFALAAVDLLEHARPGETLAIPFSWHSDVDVQEDYTQFLHFGHQESGAWWVYDQQPLGPRLPTRLWYNGLIDSETWQVPLPADLARGQYNVFTGLYRQNDLERIPARDADGISFLDGRVPLGSLTIER